MAATIKVAHLITRLIIGGAQENTLSSVLDLMKRPGYDVSLITGPGLGPEGSLEDTARDLRVPMIVLPLLRRNINPVYDLIAFFQLVCLFRKHRFDVVHTHSSKAGILGRLAAFVARTPVVVHTIHGLPFHPYEKPWRNAVYIFLEKWCAKVSDTIVTVSDTMRDKALHEGIGSKSLYKTIYSGMDIDAFARAPQMRDAMRKKLGIKPDDLVIGKIARLFYLKGHDFVVDCAAEIIKKVPATKFLFIGEGILREQLMQAITDQGIAAHFIFTGLVPPETIPDYISSMDILVHASLREGLARALPQALAAGVPVVALDIDSAHEVVIPGQTGFLVPPGDRQGFIEATVKLLSEHELRTRMGKSGNQLVVPKFSTRVMCDQLEHLYRELLTCGS